jgi:hypothetical protein
MLGFHPMNSGVDFFDRQIAIFVGISVKKGVTHPKVVLMEINLTAFVSVHQIQKGLAVHWESICPKQHVTSNKKEYE